MHRILVFATFGFLTFSGTMHFIVDVLSQYLRGKRIPSPETTLYYGLNTAYALGQVLFGVLALLVARRAFANVSQLPVMALAFVAALAWLGFGFAFFEYWEPRASAAFFGLLVIAATVTR
jgi:hypothetical protein